MNCMKRDGKHSLTHTTGNYLRNSFDTTILQQMTYEPYSNHFPYYVSALFSSSLYFGPLFSLF